VSYLVIVFLVEGVVCVCNVGCDREVEVKKKIMR